MRVRTGARFGGIAREGELGSGEGERSGGISVIAARGEDFL